MCNLFNGLSVRVLKSPTLHEVFQNKGLLKTINQVLNRRVCRLTVNL